MNDLFAFYFASMLVTNLLILLAIGLRTVLRRQSNILKCIIWLFLLVRLLCPFSFEIGFGIPSVSAITESVSDAVGGNVVTGQMFTTAADDAENAEVVETPNYVPESHLDMLMNIWYGGMLVFVIYSLFQLYVIKRKQRFCVKLPGTENVYQWEDNMSACVIGVWKPRIYVPAGLSEEELHMIVRHEKTHIKRRDYLFILGYYAALCIHWYNPLCWIVYHMVQQDMECACDEQMLRDSGMHERKSYAGTLLKFYNPSALTQNPVISFANRNRSIKKRLENIGKKHKSRKWLICLVAAVCALAVGAGMFFHTDKGYDDMVKEMGDAQIGAHTLDVVYVDRDKIVFYDYHGMFVYDFGKRKVEGFASFKELGMTNLESYYSTEVIAAKDGNTFYLTNGFAKKYVYNAKRDILSEGTFEDSIGSKENVWVAEIEEESEIESSGPVYVLGDGTKVYLQYKGEDMSYKGLRWVMDKGGDVDTFSIFG